MEIIKLYDSIFTHTYSMSNGNLEVLPDNFKWYRGNDYCDIAVFTDFSLSKAKCCNSKYKIALLMESPEIFPVAYQYIQFNNKEFDLVLTFNMDLISKGDNYKYYPLGGSWIEKKDCHIYNKTKLVSIIASNKKVSTGHWLRHEIIYRLGHKIDVYGSIKERIDYKLDGLKDYAYSIVVENCLCEGYFTEKLIDCFLTGTIPICWGNNKFFNNNKFPGIIHFENLKELDIIIDGISIDSYVNGMKINSFYSALRYYMPENFLWDNYFKDLS